MVFGDSRSSHLSTTTAPRTQSLFEMTLDFALLDKRDVVRRSVGVCVWLASTVHTTARIDLSSHSRIRSKEQDRKRQTVFLNMEYATSRRLCHRSHHILTFHSRMGQERHKGTPACLLECGGNFFYRIPCKGLYRRPCSQAGSLDHSCNARLPTSGASHRKR